MRNAAVFFTFVGKQEIGFFRLFYGWDDALEEARGKIPLHSIYYRLCRCRERQKIYGRREYKYVGGFYFGIKHVKIAQGAGLVFSAIAAVDAGRSLHFVGIKKTYIVKTAFYQEFIKQLSGRTALMRRAKKNKYLHSADLTLAKCTARAVVGIDCVLADIRLLSQNTFRIITADSVPVTR